MFALENHALSIQFLDLFSLLSYPLVKNDFLVFGKQQSFARDKLFLLSTLTASPSQSAIKEAAKKHAKNFRFKAFSEFNANYFQRCAFQDTEKFLRGLFIVITGFALSLTKMLRFSLQNSNAASLF